ncbi:MAG TPA: NADH-quinone oxidoreductase subunit NuoK [bacterium]|jgi:NADH:ubiquinone oxidoreductase subunit K|nr:NADH-quinone oxidoreductase subunit NuoK [bacterium]
MIPGVGIGHFLVLSAALFSVGLYGVIARRSAVGVLMGLELMFNAANLNLVAFNAYLHSGAMAGQMFTLFTITIAAAEATVGLALVVSIFRARRSVRLEHVDLLKG